ncbi:hypothetical protein B0H14DRAFT_3449739 [Mycena olivaceomarginata]|nr:hypothetical protein B0H14DRAFT_3449739 [Mycena olivaceomarginata]
MHLTKIFKYKASYSQQHVQERALERYALTLLADDYRKLNEAVQRARSSEGESNAAVTESAESELEPSPAPGAMTLLNEEGDEQIWGVGWGGQTLERGYTRDMTNDRQAQKHSPPASISL